MIYQWLTSHFVRAKAADEEKVTEIRFANNQLSGP